MRNCLAATPWVLGAERVAPTLRSEDSASRLNKRSRGKPVLIAGRLPGNMAVVAQRTQTRMAGSIHAGGRDLLFRPGGRRPDRGAVGVRAHQRLQFALLFLRHPPHVLAPEGETLSVRDILGRLEEFPTRYAVVTGGEPLIAPDIEDLCAGLREHSYHITVETAATVFKPIACDLASLSPKLSSSTPHQREGGRFALPHEAVRRRPDVIRAFLEQGGDYQLKFVIDRPEDEGEVMALLAELPPIDMTKVLLMPQGVTREELAVRGPWVAEVVQAARLPLLPAIAHRAVRQPTRDVNDSIAFGNPPSSPTGAARADGIAGKDAPCYLVAVRGASTAAYRSSPQESPHSDAAAADNNPYGMKEHPPLFPGRHRTHETNAQVRWRRVTGRRRAPVRLGLESLEDRLVLSSAPPASVAVALAQRPYW